MEIVIKMPEEELNKLKRFGINAINIIDLCGAVVGGTPLPERHGDLKDIGNMELLNVQVHDDYSKGWHNAIEYCVRQLRERTTIIPATKEGDGE